MTVRVEGEAGGGGADGGGADGGSGRRGSRQLRVSGSVARLSVSPKVKARRPSLESQVRVRVRVRDRVRVRVRVS